MTGKLTPEGEVIAAYGAAMVAAFQVLINCIEENDAVLPGQFPDALGVYMEIVKSKKGDVSDMTLQCSTTFGRLHRICRSRRVPLAHRVPTETGGLARLHNPTLKAAAVAEVTAAAWYSTR